MLSSLMSSSANSHSSIATAQAALPASVETAEKGKASNTAESNLSLDSNSAASTVDEVFAGELNEALMSAEQVAAEIPVAEPGSEQTAASQTQTQTQPQKELSAEEWLLAALDQQLLQLQARDAVVAAPVVNGVANAPQSPAETAALNAVEKFAGMKSFSSLVAEKTFTKAQVNPAIEKNAVIDKAQEAIGKNLATLSATNANPNVAPTPDTRAADNNSAAIPSNASAAAINSASANMSTATALADSSMNNSQLHAAAASTATGDNSLQRSVQSQVTLHAPEAKWGEQLLHALRDNVQVQIQQKIQNATIRLDPPELGSLEIFLSHESGRLTVNITASQADVARLIQTTSDRLRQELAGPQFTQVNVQTSADGQSGQQQSRERQRFFGDEHIMANEQPSTSNNQQTNRSGDVLVIV